MILFTILMTVIALIAAVLLTFTGVIGGATLLVFGDVIVFVVIMALLVKLLKKKE